MAPHAVAESLKGAAFCAELFALAGYATDPAPGSRRGDVIQAVMLGDGRRLRAFCEGVQKGSAVDSHVTPEAGDMPGYGHPVIMASGGFVQGSTAEISADAPMRPPYAAFVQGGLVYESAKLAILSGLDAVMG